MSLFGIPCGPLNLIGRPCDKPGWYPTPTAQTSFVEIWWFYVSRGFSSKQKLPTKFSPGQKNIDIGGFILIDQPITLFTVSYSPSGAPDASRIYDSYLKTNQTVNPLKIKSTDSACTLTKIGSTTETNIDIAVTNFSSAFATGRKVRSADNMAMTLGVIPQIVPANGTVLSGKINFNRASVGGQPARTIYVAVSHTSGDPTTGIYNLENSPLAVTFAANGGSDPDPAGGGDPVEKQPALSY